MDLHRTYVGEARDNHVREDERMRGSAMAVSAALVLGGTLGTGESVAAQDPGSTLLEVGAMAPDFALPGATRYGALEDEVRLSDYLGETVVLAFFFRVRTRG